MNYDNDSSSNTPKKIFNKKDIEKICDAYINNNLHKDNPIFIDLNHKGIFDMLVFNDGSVEYYKNIGSLEEPNFVLENSHFNKYEISPILKNAVSLPIFLARGGDGKLETFIVKKLGFNSELHKYNYRVLHSENFLSLDEESLITLILASAVVIFFVTYIIFIAAH